MHVLIVSECSKVTITDWLVWSNFMRLRWYIALGVVVLSALAAYLILGTSREEPKPRPDGMLLDKYLRDRAAEVGLNFRMAFMPGENGEKFKTNLYDHGCGVAVADIDSDGYDDIYFCNQL